MCAQSCPTLWGPLHCSLLGSSVNGIFQVRRLAWVGSSSFRGSSQPRDQTCGSCVSCTGRQILLTRCHSGSPMAWNALCLFVSKDSALGISSFRKLFSSPFPGLARYLGTFLCHNTLIPMPSWQFS